METLLPARSQIAPGLLDSVAAGTTAKAVSDMTAALQKKYPAVSSTISPLIGLGDSFVTLSTSLEVVDFITIPMVYCMYRL